MRLLFRFLHDFRQRFLPADAETYAVWESGRAKAGDKDAFLGYMHLDLFPRENSPFSFSFSPLPFLTPSLPTEYGHAAVWGLLPGWTAASGKREYPVVCMVANLSKPTEGKPATLLHDQLVTFFHEMGHALHGILSKTTFAKFHGTAVARDFVRFPLSPLLFVETPSIVNY